MMTTQQWLRIALEQGKGILRLCPNWVPRVFCTPGRRLKLHPDDYYALGAQRGGIDERWFASTVRADNGPGTPEDEGLSYIYIRDGSRESRVLLKDAIELMGDTILGSAVIRKHGGWTMFSKFFDNYDPLPLHLHQNDELAAHIGQKGKPEAYYFPPQLNNHRGYFPYTFFGLHPGTTKDDVRECLNAWHHGDNGILNFSRAYKLQPGTGWNVPPGILHAPGSLLTYEPQRASDVFAMFQSLVWDRWMPWDMVIKDVPKDRQQNLEYILEMIDWEANCDPDFYQKSFTQPTPVKPLEEMRAEGYEEYWIAHASEYFSAKELRILPNRNVTLKEEAAYGAMTVQGHGQFGTLPIETPTMIHFGQMTNEEVFVSIEAARNGITITNTSNTENLVLLKHFGPAV